MIEFSDYAREEFCYPEKFINQQRKKLYANTHTRFDFTGVTRKKLIVVILFSKRSSCVKHNGLRYIKLLFVITLLYI